MKAPIAFLVVAAAGAALGEAGEITLAERGKPAARSIVTPADASPSLRYAAEELQRFGEKLTGVKWPIVGDEGNLPPRTILIGDTRHTEKILGGPAGIDGLGEEGFRLVTRPPHLLVLGGPVRGALYGVYELLEKYGGCRWYASWHSVIPKLDVWKIPEIDDAQKPAFAMREPFWFDFFDGDLAARNKANGHAMRLTERHGGKVRFGDGFFVHTFNTLCPPEEFFESHPEYFSEIDGRRTADHSQLCLTNPDVLKIVTGRLLAAIRKDPEAKLFSVSQNDWRNPCACPSCREIDEREGSHAGTMITFVNQVAGAVEKEFPDVWIETLAYQYTRQPPKTVRPRRNVVPRLCTIECDFSKPLDRSAYEENRKFVEELRGWNAITDKLYIWDYTTNFRAFTGPFPNVSALRGNVQLFRDNGVAGLFEQGAYQGRHADFAELKAWLLAKWLWNPDRPAGPLLDDFFHGYYGKAAPLAREYFDELHKFYEGPDACLRIFDDVRKSPLTEDFLIRAADLWRRAEELVKDEPKYHYNVRMGAIPVLHARVERLPNPEQIKVWLTREPKRFALPKTERALVNDLLGRLREAGNVRISENEERNAGFISGWTALSRDRTGEIDSKIDRVTIEDTVLSLSRRGVWGIWVEDKTAGDGSAMKLFNTHYEWCAQLPFRQVAFDPGVRHRIRARLRVEKEPGAEGEAFWAGIYDTEKQASRGQVSRKVSEMEDGYRWIDVAEWMPESGQYFWIGPGRFDLKGGGRSAIRALYIDCLELSRTTDGRE